MLAGKRALRVGDQLLKEIAELLTTRVRDPRVSGVTLTGIDMSDDLRFARIFYSVIGDENDIERIQEGLDKAKGFIKREVGFRIKLRYMPEILFLHDPTLEMGNQIEKLLAKIKQAEDPKEEP